MRSIAFHALFAVTFLIGTGCQEAPSPATAGDVHSPAGLDPLGAPAFEEIFWSFWGDGKAEVSGYELTTPRYGELREGTAVAIFVTETFSNGLRVKADPGEHPASDEYPVLKLNLVEDFPTGIYDYNLMTSAFLALKPVNGRPAGSPTKVSFSAQEWCGHVYSQLLFDADAIRRTAHSYFDGEADQQGQLEYPADGISEDTLWFWARDLAAPKLEPGESAEVSLLMSLSQARTSHRIPAWRPATLSRSGETEEVTVPAGTFTVERWSARVHGGPQQGEFTRTFYVETGQPRRIIRWETSGGETAQMLASERLEYWKMNAKQYQSSVEKIGLSPRPPHTP